MKKVLVAIKNWFKKRVKVTKDFLKRRPHRTLKLTRKRDYTRSLKLPGYMAFTREVWSVIWSNKKLFIKFLIVYAILSVILMGTFNPESYDALRNSINAVSTDLNIERVSTLFFGAITGSTSSDATLAGQILTGIFLLIGWLVIVWILRRRLAGDKINLRDAIYSAGSPIVSILILLVVVVIQLLPLALVLLVYSTLTGTGIINWSIDIENMAAFVAVVVVAMMTLYWLVTSFLALIIVTNTGVYPFQALRLASDIAVGRRLRIIYRLLFMCIPLVIVWIAILVPIIILDDAVQISWLPLVQIFTLILTTVTLIWVASYIYLLYRYIIEDDAPAALPDDKKKTLKKDTKKVIKLGKLNLFRKKKNEPKAKTRRAS